MSAKRSIKKSIKANKTAAHTATVADGVWRPWVDSLLPFNGTYRMRTH